MCMYVCVQIVNCHKRSICGIFSNIFIAFCRLSVRQKQIRLHNSVFSACVSVLRYAQKQRNTFICCSLKSIINRPIFWSQSAFSTINRNRKWNIQSNYELIENNFKLDDLQQTNYHANCIRAPGVYLFFFYSSFEWNQLTN